MSNTDKVFGLENGRPFAAVAVVEGIDSRDTNGDRMIQEGAVFTDQVPFPLLYGHDVDDVIGRVDRFYSLAEASPDVVDRAVLESPDVLQFDPEAVWIAEGYFASTSRAVEVQDLVELRMMRGVSVGAGQASTRADVDDQVVFNQFQVIELSVTSQQALGPAMVWMSDQEFVSIPERERVLAKFSGELNGFPIRPDASFFELPDVIPSAPSVSDDGKYVAWAAQFGVAHRGIKDKVVELPRNVEVSEFMVGNVRLSSGGRVSTGVVCLGMKHSELGVSGPDCRSRYEDSGAAVVDVVLHRVDGGVVAVGAVRPTVSLDVVRELEAAPLSPECRLNRDSGRLGIYAVLPVNAPAFPVKALFEVSTDLDAGDAVGLVASNGRFEAAEAVEEEAVEEVAGCCSAELKALTFEVLKLKMKVGHN